MPHIHPYIAAENVQASLYIEDDVAEHLSWNRVDMFTYFRDGIVGPFWDAS